MITTMSDAILGVMIWAVILSVYMFFILRRARRADVERVTWVWLRGSLILAALAQLGLVWAGHTSGACGWSKTVFRISILFSWIATTWFASGLIDADSRRQSGQE